MSSLPTSITTRLQYQHKSVLDIIDGLTDEQLRRQVIAGMWSIFENLVHLQTYQHTFIHRIKRILQEVQPFFERYTAEADPLFLDNCGKPTREIMSDLLSVRKKMAAEITIFPQEDLSKTGVHPVYGQLTIVGWLHFFLLHEAHHVFSIFKLAGALRK